MLHRVNTAMTRPTKKDEGEITYYRTCLGLQIDTLYIFQAFSPMSYGESLHRNPTVHNNDIIISRVIHKVS